MRKYALYAVTLYAAMIPSAVAAEFTAVDLAKEEGKFAAYAVKNGMRAILGVLCGAIMVVAAGAGECPRVGTWSTRSTH